MVLTLCGLLLGWLGITPALADLWQRDPVLSRLLIKQLLTDSDGFQWVATDEGVFRYDGYELVPLARLLRPGSPPAPKGQAFSLCLDARGHLWLGTDAGLFCLTLRTGAFRRVLLPHEPARASQSVFRLFIHPRTRHLWVSYRNSSLAVLDTNRDGQLVSARRPLPGVGTLFQPDGTPAGVWISFLAAHYIDPATQREQLTPPGLARLGLAGPVQQYWQMPYVLMPVPDTRPLQLFSASALFTLGGNGQLREISRWLPAGREENFWPALTHAGSVCEWVSQHHYLRLRLRGAQAGSVVSDSLILSELPNYYRHNYQVYQDSLGVQWCYATAWRGVYKRRVASVQVVRPLTLAGGKLAPSARGITRLADGRLFLSTYGGSFGQAADSPRAPLRPLNFYRSGITNSITAFDALTTRTRPITTVVAQEEIGFSVLELSTNSCPLLPLEPTERHRPTRFQTLCEDLRGRTWGGTDSGLFQLDLRGRHARRYQPPSPARPLPLLQILDLAADFTTDHIWLATQQGLYRLAPATGELHRVGTAVMARPLPTDDLLCVAAAGPGRAWVGTRSEGLLLVDAQRGLVQQLSIAEGLPNSTVGTVLCRPDGAVWAGTYAGLVRYDPARQRLAVFGQSAGLTDPELNRNSAYADPRTGQLLFGGVGGLYQVVPTTMGEAEAERQQPIRLLVTAYGESARADGDNVALPLTARRGGSPLPALHLGARPTDFVEIRLALTDLLNSHLTRYAYRLRPATEDRTALPAWQPTTRQLVLQGLAPGNYTLEIRAETSGGQLAANMVRVPLHVARVWWQNPLVGLLAALVLVSLAYGLFWLQGRRARRDAQRDARLRDELAANLHDEVGGLLTKISLMAEVLQHADNELAVSQSAIPAIAAKDPVLHQLAARLLLNSRAAVQALRDAVWSIDSRADSVQALLDRMEDHLDQTAAVAGLHLSFEADPLAHLQALRPLVRKHVYLIFKEAVTNVVRHAKSATTLHVQLLRDGSFFVLAVLDNGQNPTAGGRSGLGLRNMAARAKAIGGTLYTGRRMDGEAGYEVRLRVKG